MSAFFLTRSLHLLSQEGFEGERGHLVIEMHSVAFSTWTPPLLFFYPSQNILYSVEDIMMKSSFNHRLTGCDYSHKIVT